MNKESFWRYAPLPVRTRGRGRLWDSLTFGKEMAALAGDYVRSWPLVLQNRAAFKTVTHQCLFIGCPKTGHSLIGALLDAHPDMVIPNEFGVSKYVLAGFSREQIYSLLLERSQRLSYRGHLPHGFDYTVPNQWQGHFRELRVIGDKHAEGEMLRVMARPWLFHKTRALFGQVKYIHVIRNPYDAITSLTLPAPRHLELPSATRYFFKLCDTLAECRAQIEAEHLYELRHEAFVARPAHYLKELCAFLTVPAEQDYLDACASIVFASPRQTRRKGAWTPELIDQVQSRLGQYPFFANYDFESP